MQRTDPTVEAAVIGAFATTGSKNGTARVTGVPRTTVLEILRRNKEAVSEAQKSVSTKLLGTADRALDYVSDAKLKKSSASQLMVIAGIGAQRHMELESGQLAGSPVVNVQILNQAAACVSKDRAELTELKAMLKEVGQNISSLKARLDQAEGSEGQAKPEAEGGNGASG